MQKEQFEKTGVTVNDRNELTMQLLIRCYIHQVCRCDEAKARLLMAAIKRESVRMRLLRRLEASTASTAVREPIAEQPKDPLCGETRRNRGADPREPPVASLTNAIRIDGGRLL
jgi:hypothetical protein